MLCPPLPAILAVAEVPRERGIQLCRWGPTGLQGQDGRCSSQGGVGDRERFQGRGEHTILGPQGMGELRPPGGWIDPTSLTDETPT